MENQEEDLPLVEDQVDQEELEQEQGEKSREEEAEDDLDPEGWLDLLGSGRVKKRVLKEGKENCRPKNGDQVQIHLKGKQWIEE